MNNFKFKIIKRNKEILLVTGVIILMIFVFGSKTPFVIVRYGDYIYKPEVKNIIWNNLNVHLETPHFGSLTNSRQYQICRSEDGDITLNNNYDISGNMLKLFSSMSSNRRHGCANNYIKAKINLPEGSLLKGICKLSASSPYDGTAYSSCKIDGFYSKSLEISEFQQRQGYPTSLTDNFEITLDEPKTIEVIVESRSSYTDSASSTLRLELITKQTYYKYDSEKNECTEVLIYPNEVKADYYKSLSECEAKIVHIPTQPTTPEPSGFQKFISFIINWIKNLFNIR